MESCSRKIADRSVSASTSSIGTLKESCSGRKRDDRFSSLAILADMPGVTVEFSCDR